MIRLLAPIIIALALCGPAAAQTAISKELANQYYENCRGKSDPRMKTETLDALCSCTAAKMMTAMSVEDVQTMGANASESRKKMNTMLLEVYAPCMNYPVADMVESACMADDKLEGLSGGFNKADLCSCMSEKTGDWFANNGRALMTKIIAENPNIYDPITPVMEHPAFKNASYSYMIACTMK